MSVLDPFKNQWFGMTSLTGKVEKMDFVPSFLESLGIFTPEPVNTYDLFVDRSDQTLSLVPTSELGAPPTKLTRDQRDVVTLQIPRIAQDFTLHTHELIGLRGFNTEETMMNYQAEFLKRFNKMQRKRRLTEEFHRLGALQGILLDADGTSVIHNYYTKFDVTAPAAIEFEFSSAAFDVSAACDAVVRGLTQSARGAFTSGTTINALCGHGFFDKLRYHPTVEKYYIQSTRAGEIQRVGPYQSWTFGGITWHDYRGTDDNSTVAIPDGSAKIFPAGAEDVFTKAMGPSEFGDYLNAPGRPFYAYNEVDPSPKQAWTKGEVYGYNLYFCQRPDLLRELSAT